MVLHFLFLDVIYHRQCIAWNYWKSHQILSYMLNPQSIAVQRKSFINTINLHLVLRTVKTAVVGRAYSAILFRCYHGCIRIEPVCLDL